MDSFDGVTVRVGNKRLESNAIETCHFPVRRWLHEVAKLKLAARFAGVKFDMEQSIFFFKMIAHAFTDTYKCQKTGDV